jgi:hypothetical protein
MGALEEVMKLCEYVVFYIIWINLLLYKMVGDSIYNLSMNTEKKPLKLHYRNFNLLKQIIDKNPATHHI